MLLRFTHAATEFITLLGGAAASSPLAVRAQQPAMPTVGFLRGGSLTDVPMDRVTAFHQGLKEAGFVQSVAPLVGLVASPVNVRDAGEIERAVMQGLVAALMQGLREAGWTVGRNLQIELLDPTNSRAYKNRGDAYENLGQLDRALEDYDEAVRIDPKYLRHFNRGDIPA